MSKPVRIILSYQGATPNKWTIEQLVKILRLKKLVENKPDGSEGVILTEVSDDVLDLQLPEKILQRIIKRKGQKSVRREDVEKAKKAIIYIGGLFEMELLIKTFHGTFIQIMKTMDAMKKYGIPYTKELETAVNIIKETSPSILNCDELVYTRKCYNLSEEDIDLIKKI